MAAARLGSQSSGAFDVFEKSIGELQAALAGGRVTSARLVELYLDRIRAYDQAGPRLNAVLHLNANAAREARDLDAERKRRGPRGPLHGIPVLLKDNFDTRDMPTTGGSLALSGVVPAEDAYQVKRLRQAGAVILGKVNLHELALGLTTVSSLGGQTLNPYDVTRSPGGSSGGSGVAAAASFAAVTLGTDTSGSIRIPSSHNSLVGLRPTAGLSSRAGIIPFGHTQDTGGPMARSVSDVAIVLDATAGYDPADPVTALSKGRIPATYTSALRADALSGARVGVLREFFGTAPEDEPVAAVVRQAVEDMKARGATAVDIVVPNLTQQLTASSLLTQELKFDLRDYLRRSRGARIKSLEELLSSGLHTAQFQGFVEGANALADDYPASADYRARLAARDALGRAVLAVMDDHKLDALVYPTVRRIAPLVGGNQAGSNAGLSAQTGFPAITVPAGFTASGFPVGVELLGRPFAEPTLLRLAFSYESATRHRRRAGRHASTRRRHQRRRRPDDAIRARARQRDLRGARYRSGDVAAVTDRLRGRGEVRLRCRDAAAGLRRHPRRRRSGPDRRRLPASSRQPAEWRRRLHPGEGAVTQEHRKAAADRGRGQRSSRRQVLRVGGRVEKSSGRRQGESRAAVASRLVRLRGARLHEIQDLFGPPVTRPPCGDIE